MNKEWMKPELEVLDIKMTLTGTPNQVGDAFDVDGEELHGPS